MFEGQRSDTLLEEKIFSLKMEEARYYHTLTNYFRTRTIGQSEIDYESSSKVISLLWKGSDKDPAVFKEADLFEPILKKIPGIRDHRIHSFKVFLLGYYLINAIKKNNPSFDFKTNDYNLSWMLSATFHDIGYAVQETEFWLNRMFEEFLGANPRFAFNMNQVMPMIYLDFMRILSAYHQGGVFSINQDLPSSEIDWIFYDRLNSELVEKNHGVISALMLAHLLGIRQGFLKAKDKWDFKINHLPACHAIAAHNIASVHLNFSKHPFAFLLLLCDELQDWSRSASDSPQKTNYALFLREVEVLDAQPISIKLHVKASKGRIAALRESLLTRLFTGGKISVSIADAKGNTLFEIQESEVV